MELTHFTFLVLLSACIDQFCATQVFVVKESELFLCSAWKAIMEQSLTCVETLLPKELILKISLSKNYVWP